MQYPWRICSRRSARQGRTSNCSTCWLCALPAEEWEGGSSSFIRPKLSRLSLVPLTPRSPDPAPKRPSFLVHVADLIPGGEPFEEKWVYQLRSLAWAGLANARRVLGDLSAAEKGFEMSDAWWEAGSADIGDALGYEPVLLSLKAPLRTAQRRFREAHKLLDRAVALFLEGHPEQRDPHLAGRSLITKAGMLIEQGESDAAILTLKKANGLIDPERDPRLLLCVRHNLVDNLSKMGRHTEAADLLPDLQTLAKAQGSTLDRLRLDWVAGRVAAGLGKHDQARELLTAVRRTFLARRQRFRRRARHSRSGDLLPGAGQDCGSPRPGGRDGERVPGSRSLPGSPGRCPPLPGSRPPRNRHGRPRPGYRDHSQSRRRVCFLVRARHRITASVRLTLLAGIS